MQPPCSHTNIAVYARIWTAANTLHATTLDGFMARAYTLALWNSDAMRHIGPGHYLEDRMLAALLRDMVGESRS